MDQELKITLPTKDAELILNALAALPYREVAAAIDRLVAQINRQTSDGGTDATS